MSAVRDGSERAWRARADAHEVMARTPSWSADALVRARARDGSARTTREEVDRAVALAGLRMSGAGGERDAFAREVEGILEMCGTLDGTETADELLGEPAQNAEPELPSTDQRPQA